MVEFSLATTMAFISEFTVTLRVISTAKQRPIIAGLFASGCRVMSLMVVLVVVRDSWWSLVGAGVGYFLGPCVAITITRVVNKHLKDIEESLR